MYEFTKDNETFVTSRLRPDGWECVDRRGNVSRGHTLPEDTKMVDRVVLPGCRLVPQRSIDDVVAVQKRRLEALAQNRRLRRAKQQSTKPRGERQPSKLLKALDGLPPDLQAIALQKLAKKKG